MRTKDQREGELLYLMPLWRRFVLASLLTALLLIGDFLFGFEISLFSLLFWADTRPDWLGALVLVLLWIVPVAWTLGLNGLRRASLAQFILASLVLLTLTAIAVFMVLLVLMLAASIYVRLVD